jgi:hypothetical protein|nr:hypothetical protein [Neorhizobium tomejilense]
MIVVAVIFIGMKSYSESDHFRLSCTLPSDAQVGKMSFTNSNHGMIVGKGGLLFSYISPDDVEVATKEVAQHQKFAIKDAEIVILGVSYEKRRPSEQAIVNFNDGQAFRIEEMTRYRADDLIASIAPSEPEARIGLEAFVNNVHRCNTWF